MFTEETQETGNEEYEKLSNPTRQQEAHAEEGEGPWLMSFADMVTLLMCFFILFFSIEKGNFTVDDPKKLKIILEKLTEILEKVPDKETSDTPITVKSILSSTSEMTSLKEALEEIAKTVDLVFAMAQPEPGRIDLTFLNSNFFRPGSAEISEGARKMVEVAAIKLRQLPKQAVIEIQGHTDSDPIKSPVYPSNWELSSARASTVLKILDAKGVHPEQMRAVGFAHYHPVAPEKTHDGFANPSNKALNRRIVISIRTPEVDKGSSVK